MPDDGKQPKMFGLNFFNFTIFNFFNFLALYIRYIWKLCSLKYNNHRNESISKSLNPPSPLPQM